MQHMKIKPNTYGYYEIRKTDYSDSELIICDMMNDMWIAFDSPEFKSLEDALPEGYLQKFISAYNHHKFYVDELPFEFPTN